MRGMLSGVPRFCFIYIRRPIVALNMNDIRAKFEPKLYDSLLWGEFREHDTYAEAWGSSEYIVIVIIWNIITGQEVAREIAYSNGNTETLHNEENKSIYTINGVVKATSYSEDLPF